jgi:hypothetical protein
MLAALVPSLLYIDHWGEYLDYAFGLEVEEASELEHLAHESHCHYGPSTCSEQPAPLAVTPFPQVVELPDPKLTWQEIEDVQAHVEEFVAAVLPDPPRA